MDIYVNLATASVEHSSPSNSEIIHVFLSLPAPMQIVNSLIESYRSLPNTEGHIRITIERNRNDR